MVNDYLVTVEAPRVRVEVASDFMRCRTVGIC